MTRQSKYATAITNCSKNQGLDSVKAIKKAQDVVLYCADAYKEAHMYSVVIVGSQSVADYRWAYNSMAEKLRDFGFEVEFFGAIEHEEEKGGLHCHAYYIIECAYANPAGVKRVSKTGSTKVVKIMSTQSDSWFKKTLAKRGMSFHISEPLNEVHRTRSGNMPMYARPTLRGGRLADCLVWSSYPYKVRSKAEAKKKSREIYFFSEIEANKAKRESKGIEIETVITTRCEASSSSYVSTEAACYSASSEATGSSADHHSSTNDKTVVDAGQCASGSEASTSHQARSVSSKSPNRGISSEAEQQDGTSRVGPYHGKGIEMKLTNAEKYVLKLYQKAVDADMDVEQVRKFLLSRGVLRTPGQINYDLTSVYGFSDYVASHQPKATMSVATWDRAAYKTLASQ